jgi:hypothetical protein
MRNIDKTYKILKDDAGMNYAQICGHFQALLGAIELNPEQAAEIIEQSVEIAERFAKEAK